MLLKSKTFAWGLLVLALFAIFYLWQKERQTTQQLQERTSQLKYIMENPIVKEVEGPVKIIEGPTIVRERIIEKDGEIITERETVTEGTIIQRDEVRRDVTYRDPITEAEIEKLRLERNYILSSSYMFNNNISLSFQSKFLFIYAGPKVSYDINNEDVSFGVQASIVF